MNVLGLDSKEYTISITKYAFPKRKASKGHVKVRELLKELWPFDKALEEVRVPGSKPALFIDFLVPNQRFGVEVHGRQHYEFVSHFHGSKIEFYKSQARDRRKEEWFVINEIHLIVLNTEEQNGWREQLEGYRDEAKGV